MQLSVSKYQRINRQHSIIVDISKEKLFPVLCLVREGEWLPGFSSETIYSSSGITELDSVFSTNSNENQSTIWTIPQYKPFDFIEMVYFQPGMKIVTIKLSLEELSNNQTKLKVEYIYTPISKIGEKELEKLSENKFKMNIESWKLCLDYYFKYGRIIPDSLLAAHH